MDISENVPLSSLTTFRTGGPARFLLTLRESSELGEASAFAKREGLPLIPLGSGSNMLAPDEGVEAVFVKLATGGITSAVADREVTLSADAGVSWDELVVHAVKAGWWGLENLSAIPGTVGAAVVQNIGAYGAAISERVARVDAFDTRSARMRTFFPDDCGFGYRTSVFKKEVDRYIVTHVTLTLSQDPAPNFSYKDLARRFAPPHESPSLREIRDAVIEIRKGKFPPLDEFGTAGSFFLNPIIEDDATATLSKRYPEMPLFPLPEGGTKIPLAWIFDRALSLKGERIGKAFLWQQQPLVVAADPGATANDVAALASHVARTVLAETGIPIAPEVRLLGTLRLSDAA